MGYAHIEVRRCIGALGAEVSGVDLSQPLAKPVADEIHAAWLEHQVLFFRGQQLTPAQQAEFAANFGELDVYPFVRALDAHPNVIPIIKEPHTRMNFGGGWHTDTSYLPKPPKATLLYAVEVPEEGGDTLFSNTYQGWEDFSDGMKRMLDGMMGVFSAAMVHGKTGAYTLGADHPMAYGGNEDDAEREVLHPVIRTHPETGRKAIYGNVAHTHRIKDMTVSESKPILEMLTRQATKPEYVMRFHWTPGTLAMWDNRCCWHYALNDYQGKRREMRRVIVQGDVPR
jgi:taurine dioxygenase